MLTNTHARLEAQSLDSAIRALLIEDNPLDADLLQELLETQSCPKIAIHWVERLSDGLAMLQAERFDVILLDLSLPDSSSDETLARVLSCVPDLPVLVLTGLADRTIGLQAVKEGAQDYLVKGEPSGDSIHRSIRYAIERKQGQLLLLESAARERENAEKAQESEAKLKLALSASQIGVWTWYLIEEKYDWDSEVRRMNGGIEAPATFDLFIKLVHEDDKLNVVQSFKESLKDGGELNVEYRVIWPDDTVHWISSMGKTFFDADGHAIKMTGVSQETSKHKEQEEANNRLARLEQRQEFVAMLAHDLKTPVIGTTRIMDAIVKGNLGQIPENIRDLLIQVGSSNQAMLHMINNVMDSYRLESNGEVFVCENLNVQSVIATSIAEMKILAESKQIRLSSNVAEIGEISGDKLALRRVMCNLIGNAIKFTPHEGTIEVSSFDRNGKAIIQVRDSGSGIAPSDIDHIFDRFFQTKHTYRANGLGLGLYLCRKLIEGQGGKISCASELGKGTTFEVSLPYACSKPASILVIDDSDIVGTMLQRVLKSLSIDADVVFSGSEAVASAAHKEYTAVLVDIMMPVLDGFTTTKALRDMGVKAPIIACSALPFPGSDRLRAAGLDDYIQKPISRDGMKQLVDKWFVKQNVGRAQISL